MFGKIIFQSNRTQMMVLLEEKLKETIFRDTDFEVTNIVSNGENFDIELTGTEYKPE